jgi:hypothetical protein
VTWADLTSSIASFFANDAILVVAVIFFLVLLGAIKWGAVQFGSRYGGVGLSVVVILLGAFFLWAFSVNGNSDFQELGYVLLGLGVLFFLLEVFIGRHRYGRPRDRAARD